MINLDGVVNRQALKALKSGALKDYVEQEGMTHYADWLVILTSLKQSMPTLYHSVVFILCNGFSLIMAANPLFSIVTVLGVILLNTGPLLRSHNGIDFIVAHYNMID